MNCSVCLSPIEGLYYQDLLFGDVACADCHLTNRCHWCNRYTPTIEHFAKMSCRACRDQSVNGSDMLARLILLARPIMKLHLGETSYPDLEVRLNLPVDSTSMLCGRAQISSSESYIELIPGMPMGYALGVLCHEYGHMALNLHPQTLSFRPSVTEREDKVEEGFCNVMCAVALLTQPGDDARWQSFAMPGNPDPIYGEGFRVMWKRALEVGSISALLEELTGEPHAHRGPPVDLHDEDELIPDDISPLIELSPTSGGLSVLRGTAVLTSDLPIDAPTGPRLRGRGLLPNTEHPQRGTLRGRGIRSHTNPGGRIDSDRLRGSGLGDDVG